MVLLQSTRIVMVSIQKTPKYNRAAGPVESEKRMAASGAVVDRLSDGLSSRVQGRQEWLFDPGHV